MTIQQAVANYGLQEITASSGDDLFTISRRIYESDADILLFCLQKINELYCWDVLRPGTVIKYLPKEVCSMVSEIV